MKKIKLHLGCGKRNFGSDWIHIDGGSFTHLEYYDVTRLEFGNNTVDTIYASHLIEYFSRNEIGPILNEWNRVLTPNGTLRVAVPDFESMSNLYVKSKLPLASILGPLYGELKMGESTIYHKTVYDFESISRLFLDHGFTNAHRYDWRETDHSEHDDHSQAYIPHMDKEHGTLISLNVECQKI
jgi:predicted SAM-dependent methyltransferase